jgi:enoyl-CoA hydratase/carnithine racemase
MACNMSKRQDGVAIVTLASPPVNALGAAGMMLILHLMTTCHGDGSIACRMPELT